MRLLQWTNRLLDFCYPGVCAACDASCDGKSPLCTSCLDQLTQLETAPACPACGKPKGREDAPCPWCRGKGIRHYERIVRLGVFDDPLKAIIHQMKYHNRWSLAEYLADRLLAQPRTADLLGEADCLVAVPLHPLRQIMRGFNQAELIARRLKKRCGLKMANPIVRIRNTPTQTRLNSTAKRDLNLKDAFALSNPRPIAGRRVVVIDDVTTSGATLQSIARTLRAARPASLNAIVVAIADPKHFDFQLI